MFGVKSYLLRNRLCLDGTPAKEKKIYLEWWHKKKNVGDYLATVIYEKMMEHYGLDRDKKTSKPMHLLTVGSLIAMSKFDAVIWGSGIHCLDTSRKLMTQAGYVEYDIRAVRGPITDFLLRTAGYETSGIYGDPAVLMPLFYQPAVEKNYPVSLIAHLSTKEKYKNLDIHLIDVETDDYQFFIDEICASQKVISSSLHGIILAESYGIPAVFLADGMDNEIMKFFDWYYSTHRYNIQIAYTIQEALTMEPMELPYLESMQEALMNSFPVDLWEK